MNLTETSAKASHQPFLRVWQWCQKAFSSSFILQNRCSDSLLHPPLCWPNAASHLLLEQFSSCPETTKHSRWLHLHPNFNKTDDYYRLIRPEQVVIFQLRTGHKRTNHHLYAKFGIGKSAQWVHATQAARQQDICCTSSLLTRPSETSTGGGFDRLIDWLIDCFKSS